MKKFIWSFIFVALFLVGCTNLNNTPINKVEDLFNNYQTLDESIINDLNKSLENTTYTESQKEKYKDIMKNQYKSLTYQIKDDEINGDIATVTVAVTVKDYYKILKEANIYFESHKEEFLENGSYTIKFNDYKLDKLKDAKDKVTYTIDFHLTKVNDKWMIDELSDETLDKISGIYAY
ncbi:MAG: hypothetical protein IJ565_06480 [Bacilli bacterium]|nr:hypothetical protein [Bacilli bacterium]